MRIVIDTFATPPVFTTDVYSPEVSRYGSPRSVTVPDLGPERPQEMASETRQMVQRARTESHPDPRIGNRMFLIGLIAIVAAILAFALLR